MILLKKYAYRRKIDFSFNDFYNFDNKEKFLLLSCAEIVENFIMGFVENNPILFMKSSGLTRLDFFTS